ncbi:MULTISPECIES: hypothetical protein [unclassified Caballeronia]|uniref:hypothetical protein n=1 Tax=unclassified Caballeronia TaxID=2646786 RepID=UPI002865F239|nr:MULTISPECIES: hypothetical protein [unclassified Caballeronia]MDR5771015.1 hypothetical protein [Caballeronia sp. LZ002]MDR5802483.1 hypothetical protein [Caballeronia sp. LZ001]MDR5846452.1 hypothetical protein [Caballeronia sp. LZ003]
MGIGLGLVGLGLAAFTAGTSIAAAGGVIAAIESASAVGLAVGTAGVVADVTAIASGAVEDSDSKASAILGWMSLGAGALGVAFARPFGLRGIARTANEGAPEFVAMGGNIRLLVFPYQSAFYFGDNYKGLRRLNIVAHSTHQHGITFLQRHPTDLLTAGQLAYVLEQSFIDIDAYRYVRLVSCFAGYGGANSYAQRFATMINKPVKAYAGRVYATSPRFWPEGLFREMHALYPAPPHITNPSEVLRYQFRAFNANGHRFRVDKSRLNYQPVHFVPQRPPLTPPLSP